MASPYGYPPMGGAGMGQAPYPIVVSPNPPSSAGTMMAMAQLGLGGGGPNMGLAARGPGYNPAAMNYGPGVMGDGGTFLPPGFGYAGVEEFDSTQGGMADPSLAGRS